MKQNFQGAVFNITSTTVEVVSESIPGHRLVYTQGRLMLLPSGAGQQQKVDEKKED